MHIELDVLRVTWPKRQWTGTILDSYIISILLAYQCILLLLYLWSTGSRQQRTFPSLIVGWTWDSTTAASLSVVEQSTLTNINLFPGNCISGCTSTQMKEVFRVYVTV